MSLATYSLWRSPPTGPIESMQSLAAASPAATSAGVSAGGSMPASSASCSPGAPQAKAGSDAPTPRGSKPTMSKRSSSASANASSPRVENEIQAAPAGTAGIDEQVAETLAGRAGAVHGDGDRDAAGPGRAVVRGHVDVAALDLRVARGPRDPLARRAAHDERRGDRQAPGEELGERPVDEVRGADDVGDPLAGGEDIEGVHRELPRTGRQRLHVPALVEHEAEALPRARRPDISTTATRGWRGRGAGPQTAGRRSRPRSGVPAGMAAGSPPGGGEGLPQLGEGLVHEPRRVGDPGDVAALAQGVEGGHAAGARAVLETVEGSARMDDEAEAAGDVAAQAGSAAPHARRADPGGRRVVGAPG